MARKGNFTVTIDPRLLAAELTQGKNGAITALKVRKAIEPDIAMKQREMVKRFMAHPVSSEISEGANASNRSGTLGGYGNLFSFLGFESGENPLEVVAQLLEAKLRYRVRSARNGKMIITIYIPKPEEIFDLTPMPWAGSMSWSEAIEKGVSNAAAYIFNPAGFPNSSSGTGLQSKNKVSGVSFKTTPYISAILKEFEKDLSKL
jgi:hypothetical protein